MKKITTIPALFLLCLFLLSCGEANTVVTPSATTSVPKATASATKAIQTATLQSTITLEYRPSIAEEILGRLSSGQYLIYNTNKLYAFSPESNLPIVLSEELDSRKVSLTFASNGKFVADQRLETLILTVFDVETSQTKEFDLDEECQSMAISPNGEWIACGAGEIYLYSLAERRKYWLTPHDSEINLKNAWYGPVFSPDNRWLVYRRMSLGYEKTAEDGLYLTNTDCLTDIEHRNEYTRGPFLNSLDIYEPFTWSPDGKYIAIITPDTIIIFNTLTQGVSTLTSHSLAFDIDWSPDGKWIAFTGDGINLIDLWRN